MPSISMKMEWESLTEKKCTTSKLQVMFFSGILMRTIAWKEIALRNCSEEIREEPGYPGVFAGKKKRNLVEQLKNTANH